MKRLGRLKLYPNTLGAVLALLVGILFATSAGLWASLALWAIFTVLVVVAAI